MRTETRTYTLYRITELSEEAKEKAHTEWGCTTDIFTVGHTRTVRPLIPFANASALCAVIGDMTHAITAMTTAAGRKTA